MSALKLIALTSIALRIDDTHVRARGLIRGQIVERRMSIADRYAVSWFRRSAKGKWIAIKSP